MHRRPYFLLVVAIVLASLAMTATPADAAPLAQSGGVHVVRSGETLSGIAARYGVSMTALARANGIRNPNFIYVGQRLAIPGAGGGSAGGGGGSTGGGATGSGGVHVVRRGETLGSIAARYGTSVNTIVRANGISNPNMIYAGQRLLIPGAGGGGGGVAVQPRPAPAPAPSPGGGARWIDIDLSAQTLTAFEGSQPIWSTLVSTGLRNTPTPVGTFAIQWKLRSQRMTGPGYDLPNVPWVMYFTGRGHAIHGAYWHNNFGSPMSHGCVNLPIANAQWLYNFSPVGTRVVVHY